MEDTEKDKPDNFSLALWKSKIEKSSVKNTALHVSSELKQKDLQKLLFQKVYSREQSVL